MEEYFKGMLEIKRENELFVWPSEAILYRKVENKIVPQSEVALKMINENTSKEFVRDYVKIIDKQ